MRRFLPSFVLSLAAVAPFVVGCDKMKKDETPDAGMLVAAIVDAGGGMPTATTAAPTDTPAAPLATTTAATTAVHVGDAGKAVAKDAGPAATATAPGMPGFPTALPSGFPTALPSGMPQFPMDAGAFKPPWQK